MSGRKIANLTLATDLIQRINELARQPELLSKLGFGPPPQTDIRGLISADYDWMRKTTGSELDGDALISYAWLPPLSSQIRQQVRAYYNAALKRNRRPAGPRVNFSRLVEALVVHSLNLLEMPGGSKPSKSTVNQSGNGRKASHQPSNTHARGKVKV